MADTVRTWRAPPGEGETHEALVLVSRSLGFAAQERQLDLTTVVMRGAGHEMPPRYAAMIGLWALGEPLPTIREQ